MMRRMTMKMVRGTKRTRMRIRKRRMKRRVRKRRTASDPIGGECLWWDNYHLNPASNRAAYIGVAFLFLFMIVFDAF